MTGVKKKVAPDGGWGYVIVLAFSISSIIAFPSFQSFGLLFRNVFDELNFSATDVSLIINVNSATGLILGIVNGPLLKKLGFRKYAMIGAFFIFIGFFATCFATTFTEFIIFYGLINSIGFCTLLASFSLALSTYFVKKRSIASGYSATLTGLGPVFMPLLISKSIDYYGVRGTALLVSGLLLHSFVAALLLQPIKWHYKIVQEEEELQPLKDPDDSKKENGEAVTLDVSVNDLSDVDLDQDILDKDTTTPVNMLDGMAYPRRVSLIEGLGRRDLSRSKLSLYDRDIKVETDTKWWSSRGSLSDDHTLRKRRPLSIAETDSTTAHLKAEEPPAQPEPEKDTSLKAKVIELFDLDLLKDPVYLNILIGMSIAYTGEINFSLMTPIILGDRHFDIDSTAKIMSTIAVSDILFRFCSPFIGNFLKLPAREMYMMSLLMLATSRLMLIFVSSYTATLFVAFGLGVAKGFRTVYMILVIPNHVPLEKLASANGLQIVLNGILLLACGPLIGYMRDAFGSYDIVIYLSIFMSLTTLVMWSIELFVVWQRKTSNADPETEKA